MLGGLAALMFFLGAIAGVGGAVLVAVVFGERARRAEDGPASVPVRLQPLARRIGEVLEAEPDSPSHGLLTPERDQRGREVLARGPSALRRVVRIPGSRIPARAPAPPARRALPLREAPRLPGPAPSVPRHRT